ncbi:MAG: reverse transcriptase family protein [Kangiellaceae bacterium]|nr:reverse transcriptase family protein [Kangiellaceae bacterium]
MRNKVALPTIYIGGLRRKLKSGQHRIRHIPTLVSKSRQAEEHSHRKGVCHRNIITVKLVPSWKESDSIHVGLLNACSVANKAIDLSEYITENELDVASFTETWLREGDDSAILDLCPPGYVFVGTHRPLSKGKTGGGVGFVLKSIFSYNQIPMHSYNTFESCTIRIESKKSACLSLIYRPPPSVKNGYTVNEFLKEFEEFASALLQFNPTQQLFIMGDFNFHLDVPNDPNGRLFNELLSALDLQQHVSKPTHRAGHLLDLIITKTTNISYPIIDSINVHDVHVSDHSLISCTLCIKPKRSDPRTITARPMKKVTPPELASKLKQVLDDKMPKECDDLDRFIITLNKCVTQVMDELAPKRNIRLKGETLKPWYSDAIHDARRKRRSIERLLRKSGLEVHRQMLKAQRKVVVNMIDQAKSDYIRDSITGEDSKRTFEIIDKMLNIRENAGTELTQNSEERANIFADFFTNKITTIRKELENVIDSSPSEANVLLPNHSLTSYNVVTENALWYMVKKMPAKTCSLDPLPFSFLKERQVFDVMKSHILKFINGSLEQGNVPHTLKIAQVKPRPKKPGVNTMDPKLFRPISNLPTIEKLLEKCVIRDLHLYIQQHNIIDPLQSAYRPGHSTETAMLRIQSDIKTSLDEGNGVLLVLLDLSAAFDTLDHNILLSRLQNSAGITGVAIDWMKSYLSSRQQFVQIEEKRSVTHDLDIGVPQGSCLGPLLFVMYTTPLGAIFRKHGLSYHQYADDTQVYCSLPSDDQNSLKNVLTRVEKCLDEVKCWMTQNKLKLNESKTECIIFSSKRNKQFFHQTTIRFGGSVITPVTSVRNLGAHLDCEMSMDKQINNTIKSAYYHLRRIAKIRRHLDRSSCTQAVVAFVSSRLDYHNGLLAGITQKNINRLQKVQNHAARLVSQTAHHCHITPVLADLHWLPIRARIDFKLMLNAHKAVHCNDAPKYMKELCMKYTPSRTLRSSSDPHLLAVKKSKRNIGASTFDVYSCKTWNELPRDVRDIEETICFKKTLKTHLYKRCF